ncbi:tRNA 2'-O-methylase [Porphyromonas cangingivalis]|nr:tRNA 2'-O-methylase [Porphyromonas cangingivalis]
MQSDDLIVHGVDPIEVIRKYYDPESEAYRILVEHSEKVAQKALHIVDAHPEWRVNRRFVYESAMLHDIGINACHAPAIDCHGSAPYILHGYIGAERLRSMGLHRHALVCERHTGTGITLEMILANGWELPHREMIPVSLEEQIVCFADKFFSKSGQMKEKSLDKIRKGLASYGQDDVLRFDAWCTLFLNEND